MYIYIYICSAELRCALSPHVGKLVAYIERDASICELTLSVLMRLMADYDSRTEIARAAPIVTQVSHYSIRQKHNHVILYMFYNCYV